jgi:hypothetical protein
MITLLDARFVAVMDGRIGLGGWNGDIVTPTCFHVIKLARMRCRPRQQGEPDKTVKSLVLKPIVQLLLWGNSYVSCYGWEAKVQG